MSEHPQCESYLSQSENCRKIWDMAFQQIDRGAQVAIVGQEGIGKTQVAIEFGNMYKEEFGFIWWIDAKKKSTIKASYMKIAETLGIICPSRWEKDIAKQIISLLEKQEKPWLLIFDNAINPEDVSEFTPKGKGFALIVSRYQSWTKFFTLSWRHERQALTISEVTPIKTSIFQSENVGINTSRAKTKIKFESSTRRKWVQYSCKSLPHIAWDVEISPPQQQQPTTRRTSNKILVAIRINPSSIKGGGGFEITKEEDGLLSLKIEPRTKLYTFDKIFQKEDNGTIFTSIISDIIQPVFSGKNACVFTYGLTGSGKTYTMFGSEYEEGIVLLTVREIFNRIEQGRVVKISFLEIYNEKIIDRLSRNSKELQIRYLGPKIDVKFDRNPDRKVENVEEAVNLIKSVKKEKFQAEVAHKNSSRSHTILTIKVCNKNDDCIGKLLLADLAGSESYNVEKNLQKIITEGNNIRKSLLALEKVFDILSEKRQPSWRDSKLTMILSNSLGNNGHNVMITNISLGSNSSCTAKTLNYAEKVKGIKGEGFTFRTIGDTRSREELLKIIEEKDRMINSLKGPYFNEETEELIKDIDKSFEELINHSNELSELEEQMLAYTDEIKENIAEIEKWRYSQPNPSRALSHAPENIKDLGKYILELKQKINVHPAEIEPIEKKLEADINQWKEKKSNIENKVSGRDGFDAVLSYLQYCDIAHENVEKDLKNKKQIEKSQSDFADPEAEQDIDLEWYDYRWLEENFRDNNNFEEEKVCHMDEDSVSRGSASPLNETCSSFNWREEKKSQNQ